MSLEALFPICPLFHNKDNVIRARDYKTAEETNCDDCKGLGVYTDVNDSVRICASYRKWRESLE